MVDRRGRPKFGKFLGVIGNMNQALFRSIILLRNFFIKRKKEQVGELLHCLGAGLMYLMFEAFPVIHSQDSIGSICLLMNVLDFDLKGSVDSHGFGAETLRVDVREVKSSLDYNTTVL